MGWFKQKRIFLDYASATPVLPEVRQAMEQYWSRDFYNPSAIYEEGVKVKKERIVAELGSHPSVSEAAKGITGVETTLISSVTTDNKLGRKIREERKNGNTEFPLLHIDASQTAGYFNVGLEALSCDLLTLDSAKLYGPKGIGALVVRKGVRLEVPPIGTPAVSLIAGFAKALEMVV